LKNQVKHNKTVQDGIHGFLNLFLILAFSTITFAQSTLTLDSVSVNENNHVIIGWTLETNVEVGHIEIHRRLVDDTYAPIISLPLTQSLYIDTEVNAENKAYSYYVVARDGDGDSFAVSNEAHQTIFQKPPYFDICNRRLLISWDNYEVTTSTGSPVPLPLPFNSTEILWTCLSPEFTCETITGIDSIQRYFVVLQEGTYCFKIRSFHSVSGKSTTSNVRCVTLNFAAAPESIDVRRLSLDESSEFVEMDLLTSSPVEGAGYILQRWNPDSNMFLNMDTLITSDERIMFLDDNPLASNRSERYRVQVLDECMMVAFRSAQVQTIYASVNSISEEENLIEWNLYDGWEHGVLEYLVTRKLFGMTDFEVIDRVGALTGSYTDNLSSISEIERLSNIEYRVIAIEMQTEQFDLTESVLSNIAILERELELFIPNAFKPQSAIAENRIFKPSFIFTSPYSYNMSIYNRWGERIFSTDDYTRGWDGRINGNEAPAGVYSYVIKYSDYSGKSYEKPGTLVLVR